MDSLLSIENSLLKQKVLHLDRLCKDHKSHYEQLKAKYEVECNNAEGTSTLRINGLMQQIYNQKQKLLTTKRQFKEDTELTAIEHQNEMQSLQQTIENMKKEIREMRLLLTQFNAHRVEELNKLQTELMQKSNQIVCLDRTLAAAYEQYTSINKSPSPPALQIRVTSNSSNTIALSPNGSCSDLSTMGIKFENRNHDRSPGPSLSSDQYDHTHLIPTNTHHRKTKSNNRIQNTNLIYSITD
eukprot:30311_1